MKFGRKEMKILYANPKEELKKEVEILDIRKDEDMILSLLQIIKYRNVPAIRRFLPWATALAAAGVAALQGIAVYLAP